MLKTELYQAITLVLVVLFFDFLERQRPGFKVTRQRELSLNVLAIVVVIVGGEMWKSLLLYGFNAASLDQVLPLTSVQKLPSIVRIVLAIILGDLTLYWVHRAMHHRPLLWRTHAFHHSIPEIWWLSGSRTSLSHLLLFAIPQILVGYYLLGLSASEAGIAFSFGVVVNLWIHLNIWVNLGPLESRDSQFPGSSAGFARSPREVALLKRASGSCRRGLHWLFITPNYHRIHHGAKGLTNKNLAFVFTIWDRIFGTYADPRVTGKDFAVFAVPTRKRLFRMVIGY